MTHCWWGNSVFCTVVSVGLRYFMSEKNRFPVQQRDEYPWEVRHDHNSSVDSTLLQTSMEARFGLLSLRTWCHLEGGLDVLCLCLFKAEVIKSLLQAHNVKANEKQDIYKSFLHPSCITDYQINNSLWYMLLKQTVTSCNLGCARFSHFSVFKTAFKHIYF